MAKRLEKVIEWEKDEYVTFTSYLIGLIVLLNIFGVMVTLIEERCFWFNWTTCPIITIIFILLGLSSNWNRKVY